jgi:uncharacterized protein (TIGR02145 family)
MKHLQLIFSLGIIVFLSFFGTASYAQTLVVSKNGGIPATDTNYVDKNGRVGGSLAITADGKEVVTFIYNGARVFYGTVTSTTGKRWLDRNLGATQVATSSTDANSYGDLYQWGRNTDGHEIRTSSTTAAQSSSPSPGAAFITGSSNWYNGTNPNDLWQGVNGTNNPCPTGYRIPTEAELNNERESWSSNNAAGALDSALKLPMPGYRFFNSGVLYNVGSIGDYWSSSVSGTFASFLSFNSSRAGMNTNYRAIGFSVRCLKD